GVTVEGNFIPKSFCSAVRQSGVKNQDCGRKLTRLQSAKAKKTVLIFQPKERRGGWKIRKRPNKATTMPSAHLLVAPPRKTAKTGSSAMKKLRAHCAGTGWWVIALALVSSMRFSISGETRES